MSRYRGWCQITVSFLYFLACGQSGTLTICAIFQSYKLRSKFPYRKFLVVIVCLWVVVIIWVFSWHNKRSACNKVKERWSLPVFFFTHISVVLYWCEIFYIFESCWTNTTHSSASWAAYFSFQPNFLSISWLLLPACVYRYSLLTI